MPSSLALAASGVPSQTTTLPTQRRISEVKELPTTGIPVLAWALVGLIPVGKKMAGYGRSEKDKDDPQSILNKKLFLS